MSDPVFLVDALPDGDLLTLDGPEGHHAATVARLRVGESLFVGDGLGTLVRSVVSVVGKGTVTVSLGERSYEPLPSPRLVVVQGIAKGDRGELAVQAMTESGVDEIVPWAAARSVARWEGPRPRERWVATAREAAKQARRSWIPAVASAVSTKDVAGRVTFVLHESAEVALSTVELTADAAEIVLVVGPEGGITDQELAAFEAAGAVAVRLGPTVLRTSTAGVAALAVLSTRVGRW
jgi:16S rRNA (uracil1498-N3)-methyltransferase